MRLNFSYLTMALWLALFSAAASAEQDFIFDAKQLGGDISNVDLERFNQGGQLPGAYTVDVLVNGEYVETKEMTFRSGPIEKEKSVIKACLSLEQLSQYGVKVEDYPVLAKEGTENCVDISAIPQAGSEFQFSNQQLLLSIPQVAMRPKLQGIAPEALWDDGISAFLMNYRFSGTQTEFRGNYNSRYTNQFIQLDPGVNVGPWRLRSNATWQKQQNESGNLQFSYAYAERGLNSMKSRLTLGERYTPSDIFDSVPFRGVMLGSDDAMVPANMRNFSPVVRGIARTQARVEVKQNGYTIYNATVAPGSFALTDLSASGSGGDLEVTVWETDGNPQFFTVPWQTPAIALKSGYLSYSLMAGQYRPSDSAIDAAEVGQATAMYGLPGNLTVYGGLQVAEHYLSASAGLGASLGSWGSLSLDATRSDGQKKNEKSETGESWRVRYSKSVESTNTTFALASYQFFSPGYYTLSEVLDSYNGRDSSHYEWENSYRERRTSLTHFSVNQSLVDFGYISFNGSREDYRGRVGHRTSYGVNYGTTVKNISLSLNWMQNRNRNSGHKGDNTSFGFYVSMPLGGSLRTNYQFNASSPGGNNQQIGFSGQAVDRQLNWNVSQSYRNSQSSNAASSMARLGWSGGYGQFSGNYSYSNTSRQAGVDAAGGMVISSEGLTFSQPLDMNNGMALVAAPGASDVPVNGWPGVKTDFRGYTTQSYMSPYQENTVSLDPTGFPPDADITQTDVKVVPTKGAITLAKFVTHIGGRAVISMKRPDGEVLPFGSMVTLSNKSGGASGVIGDGGQVYLAGLENSGQLTVRWGEGQQCLADYQLPRKTTEAGLFITEAVCQ